MAQRALPLPEARLGRAVQTAGATDEVSGVALLLPDGEADSRRRPSTLSYAVQLPFARSLARAGVGDGLAVHVLRYRWRGWNADDAHPAEDAVWAADEVQRRYGDVPVCLVGHGMGGRAALRAAGHGAVTSVLAMAPWLPERTADGPEPVKQLMGRRVLIVHGTNDERTDPELSYRLAERAKKANRDTCRFEVHSDGHALRQHRSEVVALAADFVRGSLFARSYARPVADALAAPPPLGLRMPLAAGFGRSLRH
ncbi:dienelactone hydrolase family protein [Streptomyces sp. TRM75563]|uniref:alpha/beta hydrolase family protein n=1 Tax=Streptomyces sp. TRM75563 TaxID=2817418 RepID=UPI001F61C01F|nr:dienelactone hydrolase family protein [Streptomyces sp. TRM75563]MCI4044382.1 dienelactone hydrolase family protein [Streptomyces sp. TRM75563]